ncbi:MAG: hypothetical protein ABIQ40_06570 [Bacteroidia bacterium]
MNKRPLAPKFLNRLDNLLLLNRPDTWSTRFHLLIYYCLLFMLALTAICFVIPTDHRAKSYFGLWSGAAGVLALIGFIVWIVYLLRFNVFKQFGTVFPGDRIKTFLLYFFMIVMLSLVVYIPPVVESIRADRAYDTEELAVDINRINELVVRFEQNRIPDEWIADTLFRVSDRNIIPTGEYQQGREYLDSANFSYRINYADSVRIINPNLAIVYDFMELRFVKEDRIGRRSATKLRTTKELYYSAYRNNNPLPASAKTELQNLLYKYSTPDSRNEPYGDNSSGAWYSINEKYNLSDTDMGIFHIAERKYRLLEVDYSDFIRVTYYFTLALTLLVFAFRHSTVKTFFLSLLFAVVLSILSGLVGAVINIRETGILWMMIFYFALFVTISMLIFKAKKRSLVSGIALNAFVLMTAFVPLICVALYYEYNQYYASDMYVFNDVELVKFYAQRAQHFMMAEFAGGILLLVLIETLFKRLYRLWYSSPED